MGKTADLVEEVAKEEAEKPAEIKVAEKEYVYKKSLKMMDLRLNELASIALSLLVIS